MALRFCPILNIIFEFFLHKKRTKIARSSKLLLHYTFTTSNIHTKNLVCNFTRKKVMSGSKIMSRTVVLNQKINIEKFFEKFKKFLMLSLTIFKKIQLFGVFVQYLMNG